MSEMSEYHLLKLTPRNGVTIEIIAAPDVHNPDSLYLWVNDSLLEVTRGATPAAITRLTHMAEAINSLIKTMNTDAELAAVISGGLNAELSEGYRAALNREQVLIERLAAAERRE
jgi:small ligand-binding sensory domain FIST